MILYPEENYHHPKEQVIFSSYVSNSSACAMRKFAGKEALGEWAGAG